MADPTAENRLAKIPVGEKDVSELERVGSGDDDLQKEHQDYGRMDEEVAKYAGNEHIVITENENRRLKRLIDKRVLLIMVATYFQQAMDKGTLSFTSVSSKARQQPSRGY